MLLNFRIYAAGIVITCKGVSDRSHIFSFYQGASNKNFEIIEYSLRRSFQKEEEYKKKKIKIFEKSTVFFNLKVLTCFENAHCEKLLKQVYQFTKTYRFSLI